MPLQLVECLKIGKELKRKVELPEVEAQGL